METFSEIPFSLSENRRCVVYIPWVSLVSFAFVLTGTILWAVGTSSGVHNTASMLSALRMDVTPYTSVAVTIAVLAAAFCCVFAALMLIMSCGRSCTERAVDKQGKATRFARSWMCISASLTALWWFILVLLGFVVFMSAVWFGVTYSTTCILRLSVKTADKALAKAQQVHDNIHQSILDSLLQGSTGAPAAGAFEAAPLPPMTAANAPAEATGTAGSPPPWPGNASLAPPPAGLDSDNATQCPSSCLNLALLEVFLDREICICTSSTLKSALHYSEEAHQGAIAAAVGSCLLWAGASFLLMNAAADYGKSRRERVLLFRIQRKVAEPSSFPGPTEANARLEQATGPAGGQGGAGANPSASATWLFHHQPSLQGALLSPLGSEALSKGAPESSRGTETYSYTAGSAAGGGVGYGAYGDPEADHVPLLLQPAEVPLQGRWSLGDAAGGVRGSQWTAAAAGVDLPSGPGTERDVRQPAMYG